MFLKILLTGLVIATTCVFCLVEQLKNLNQKIMFYEGLDEIMVEARKKEVKMDYQRIMRKSNDSKTRNQSTHRRYESIIKHSQLPFEQFSPYCQITQNISSFLLFQTPRHIYLIINDQQRKNCRIYQQNCEEISHINVNIKESLCDRGFCQHGVGLFLGSEGEIVQCNENDNFSSCTMYLNRELKEEEIVGVVSRNKGAANYEVYIAEKNGIAVINAGGRQRLVVDMEAGSTVKQMKQKHPNPLVLSDKGWIYIFDNIHYSLLLTKCPYVGSDVWLYLPTPYSQHFYILTLSTIYRMQIKQQSNLCFLAIRIPLSQLLTLPNNSWQSAHISQYQGYLIIDNQILNLQTGEIKYFKECGNNPVFSFQPMKNNYRKGVYALNCCQEDSQCGLVIFKIMEQTESNKGQFMLIVSVLALFIFIIYTALKPVPVVIEDMAEEEHKYTQNKHYQDEVESIIRNTMKEKKSSGKPTQNSKTKQKHQ